MTSTLNASFLIIESRLRREIAVLARDLRHALPHVDSQVRRQVGCGACVAVRMGLAAAGCSGVERSRVGGGA